MEPQSPLDYDSLEEASYFPAENWKRFVNYLVDLVIIVIIFSCIIAIFPVNAGITFLVYVVYFLYYVAMEYLFGKTIGKFLTGTVVVRNDNLGKISLSQALGRSISRFTPFEPISFVVADGGWHDKWTNTLVVNSKTLQKGRII